MLSLETYQVTDEGTVLTLSACISRDAWCFHMHINMNLLGTRAANVDDANVCRGSRVENYFYV